MIRLITWALTLHQLTNQGWILVSYCLNGQCSNNIWRLEVGKAMDGRVNNTSQRNVAYELVSPNQTAFIGVRLIADNSITPYWHLRCYGFERKRTPERCCHSIDLRKSFDASKWEAIIEILKALGFSRHICQNGMECNPNLLFNLN